jgi:hypothetical protein
MKKPYAYEAVAVVSGIAGAFVLVSGLMPFINPGFVDANATGEYSPRMAFLVPTLFSLPLLGISWHFNKKAQAIRRELERPEQAAETPTQRKLKWIICEIVILLVVCFCLCEGCERRENVSSTNYPFTVTNETVGGTMRQVLYFTNGVSLCFIGTNVTIWFGKRSDLVVSYDSKTLIPSSTLLEIPESSNRPAQSVLDLDADGVPDFRQLNDGTGTRQIFYRGDWYTRKKDGTHTIISIDGHDQEMHYKGGRWVEASTKGDLP